MSIGNSNPGGAISQLREETMLTTEEKKAYERYLQIKEILEEYNDKAGLKMLKELIKLATEYVTHVIEMERVLKIIEFRGGDPRKIAQHRESQDQLRRIKHDALIAQLRAINRYLFKEYTNEIIPIGGIFSLDPRGFHDRRLVGDWAGDLATALTKKAA